MSDQRKTKAELLKELQAARDRIAGLERAAAEAQARYRLAWDTAGDMITWHNASDGFAVVAANPAVMAHLGYSEEDLLGASALDFIHPDDVASALASPAEGATEGRTPVQVRVRKKDGTYAWVETMARRSPSGDAGPGILCITRDITERKRSEQTLRLYEMAVEGSTDFVVAIDRNYVYLLANEAFLQYHHVRRDQVVGHPAAEVLGEEFFAKLKPYCDRCLRGERAEFDIPQGTPGVNYRVSHVSYYPLQSSDGRTVGVVAIVRDATPEKELELRRGIRVELSQLLNAQIGEDELVARAARLFRDYAECDGAVARMCAGDGLPFCALDGPASDRPTDTCICGCVIAGSLDVSQPYCTARGGFWTNSLSAFQRDDAVQGGGLPTCRLALSNGCESVAILPVRAQAETLGLISFYDSRPGRFTAAGVAFLQWLADSLAIGLAHRRAQQALRESEAHLRTVLENVRELVYETDLRSRAFTYVSPSAERILGYTAEEVMQMGPAGYEQRVHPDNAGLHRLGSRRLAEAEEGWHEPTLEYRWRHRDGEYRWLSTNRRLLRDEKGRPKTMIGVARDVTYRKRSEEALRQSEARYRLLVENAGAPIFILNRDGVFEMMNSTAAEFLNGSPADLVGKTIWDLIPPPFADGHMAVIRRVIDTGEPITNEARTVLDGRELWFGMRIDPIRDEGGTISRVQAVAHDITERKQTEQDLLTHQEHLRMLASELALTEERERRQIAADLHDHIGQALTIAAMKVGLVEGDVTTPDARHALQEVGGLIGQALLATRSLTFELSPPILYDLGLESALEWLAEHVQSEHHIEVSFRDDGASKALGDDIRVTLFKAAREALFNVVKHAHASKADVAVSRCGDSIEVRIQDDGIGFSPDEHDEGFGLFSVRERLHQLGGHVGIDSRPGHGTCITLRAPLRNAPHGAEGNGR